MPGCLMISLMFIIPENFFPRFLWQTASFLSGIRIHSPVLLFLPIRRLQCFILLIICSGFLCPAILCLPLLFRIFFWYIFISVRYSAIFSERNLNSEISHLLCFPWFILIPDTWLYIWCTIILLKQLSGFLCLFFFCWNSLNLKIIFILSQPGYLCLSVFLPDIPSASFIILFLFLYFRHIIF